MYEAFIRGSKDNCVNLTTFEDGSVIDLTRNGSTDTIVVQSYTYFPEIFFWKWNETHYQWCGPMLLIVQYFAKIVNARISLLTQRSIGSLFDQALEGNFDFPHIGLVAMAPSHLISYIYKNGFGDLAGPSRQIAYSVLGRIMAATKKGQNSLLVQFECFDWEVYYGIIASIIVISCLMGLYKRSLKAFLTTFWSYLSVVLSDYYSIPINSVIERQLSSAWLLSCTVLLAAFSGQLREKALKTNPIYFIDDWDDLYEWKHLKIQTFSPTGIMAFINDTCGEETDQDQKQDPKNVELAKDFAVRVQSLDDKPFTDGFKSVDKDLDYEGIKTGKTALVLDGLQLDVYKFNVISNDFKEDIDFHVSKSGHSSQPFFNIFNRNLMNDSMIKVWNFVIVMLTESGVYNEFQKRSMNPNKTGPDFDERAIIDSYEFQELFVYQLRGILFLYLICLMFAIILFFSEFFIQFNKY